MKLYSSFNKNTISIDLGSYETKITEGKEKREGITITKAFTVKTLPGSYENGYIKDMEKLLYALSENLKENKITSGNCHLSIKSTDIISREIPFPVVTEAEIDGLLKYQLEEYLPMDASKYVIKHKTIGISVHENNEKLMVLVVAIPKEMVEAHYNLINSLGLKPTILDYQSNGIWKLLNFADYLNVNNNVRGKTIGAIDLGHKSTNVAIVKNGVLQTSRVIEAGGISLEGKEKSEENNKNLIENIIDRIDNVFKYYISKEMGNQIDQILLYGGLSETLDVERIFSNYFSMNTELIKAIGRITMEEDPLKYINCISSILRNDETKDLNFFSSYNKKKEKGIDKQKLLDTFLLISLIGVIAYGSFNFFVIKNLEKDISTLQNQIATKETDEKYKGILEKEKQIRDLRDNISKITILDENLNKKDVLNEFLLNDIESNLPSKVFLNSMVLSPDIIKLEGKSEDKQSIAQFQHNLIELGYFQNVFIPQISDDTDSFGFIIDIKYKGEE